MVISKVGLGRARVYVAKVNFRIFKYAAARHQGHHDRAAGARLPVSLAGAPMRLSEIVIARDHDTYDRMTPLGYKTARRAPPAVLAALPEGDPRLRAADYLVDAVERVGSVRGVDWMGSDSKGGQSDGGVTTRLKHSSRLRLVEALANAWPVTATGKVITGPPRVLLPIERVRGNRQQIMALRALYMVCVQHRSLDDVLRSHGWSAHTFNRDRLRLAILGALGDVACGLGYEVPDAP